MRKIFLTLFLTLTAIVSAQISDPITVKSSIETKGNEAVITFKATIEDGWHLYSANLPEGGPTSASVKFETLQGAELIGELTPGAGEIEKQDPIFEMKVKYFENEAVFTQKLKLLGGNFVL